MQLTKLEVKGFKSFGDKITIHFNEGVTAIVGPNGCGKSNVVDAIRWVLGEQSTRMLRSEKMENIIFNGTKNRKASNLAEVSLSFDNTKNVLPTEFSQVTITRKLYRSGESEYRLNDVKCRLKDITDLFLDTGIGPDSYSIIELRMIDEIINNKEHSRRNLFEEASGISKYKIRKKQTFSRLKETQSDLDRVEDLLFEIEKNLKSLESQAKKTERYYKIKENYKQISLALARSRIRHFDQAFTAIEEEKNKAQAAQAGLAAQISSGEAELQAVKQSTLVLEKNLATQQKATNEQIGKIRSYESDKKLKNEQLRHLQAQESRLSAENTQDKQQLNHVAYNIKRLHEETAVEQLQFEQIQVTLQTRNEEMSALRGQQQSLKTKLDLALKSNADKQQEIYDLEKEATVLGIQKDALEQESLRNRADTESKETELDQFNNRVRELKEQLEGLQEQLEETAAAEQDLETRWKEAETRSQTISEEINKQNRLLDAKQNEYNLTKSLVDNLEGFPESIRFLRKKANWKEAYPLFSDILFCKEEYRIAIENHLDSLMNHYVVDTLEEAIHGIQLLNDGSRGRAQFFVLEVLDQHRTAPSTVSRGFDAQSLVPAMEVIKVDDKYLPLCQLLLQDVYLLKDPKTEPYVRLPYPEAVVLHPAGKFGKERWGIGGGSIGLFEGKRIGRAKNLENLAKEIKIGNERIKRQEAELSEIKSSIIAWKASSQKDLLEELTQRSQRLNSEWISVKTKQEQYLSFIANSKNRKQDIADKLAEISQQLAEIGPRLLEKKQEKLSSEADLRNLQEEYAYLSDDLTDKSTLYNQENLRFHQQQNKLSGLAKDLEYRENQQYTFQQRLDKNLQEYAKTQTAIQEILQHVDDSDEDLLEMYKQKEAFEEGLKSMEAEFSGAREKIIASEQKIADLRKSKESADAELQQLKEKETQIRIDLNGLKERLSAEFDLDIRDLLAEEEEGDLERDTEALATQAARLKKQLDDFGSINPLAMEAYEEMRDRHGFILKEKQDLAEAKNSLLETIAEIDLVAKTQFLEAFHKVREHFIEVFRSLFNAEDSCDLVLTQPNNPLDSDIDIIARPKGKRPLSINQLSGGEKTLTSTALLFSLYLLKPAPFCIFDEVDAPLDDTNIDKFNNIIREFSSQSQFIIVSHNKKTIASTDIIYGVTMVEQGVSRVVAVDMREVV